LTYAFRILSPSRVVGILVCHSVSSLVFLSRSSKFPFPLGKGREGSSRPGESSFTPCTLLVVFFAPNPSLPGTFALAVLPVPPFNSFPCRPPVYENMPLPLSFLFRAGAPSLGWICCPDDSPPLFTDAQSFCFVATAHQGSGLGFDSNLFTVSQSWPPFKVVTVFCSNHSNWSLFPLLFRVCP